MRSEVRINSELYTWAIERAGMTMDDIKSIKSLSKIEEWITLKSKPTFRQLELFAKTVYMPLRYLFLDKPLIEKLPITDFRTKNAVEKKRKVNLNLLDTIRGCQRKQRWYKQYAIEKSLNKVDILRSVKLGMDHVMVADDIRRKLMIPLKERPIFNSHCELLKFLIMRAEEAGI